MGGQGSGRKIKCVAWTPDPGTEPWERQSYETDPAWRAFVTYRDMPGRTLAKATALLGKKPGYLQCLEDWSRMHNWRKRVEAWDSYKDSVSREAELEARRQAATDMVDRHLGISTHLQRLVTVELMRWIHMVGANSPNPDLNRSPSLNPTQIQSLLDYAVKLERLNRNEPGEITESRSNQQLSREELEERITHLLKVRESE